MRIENSFDSSLFKNDKYTQSIISTPQNDQN